MKIVINVDHDMKDTEISISCSRLTPEIEKMISMIRMYDLQMTGKKDGEVYLLNVTEIIYIDTADKRTFFYTEDAVYESSLKLYELEEQLVQSDFIRVSKSCIINMRHILSLKAEANRRIKLTMDNQEQLMISRQYAEKVKERLGVR